VAAAPVVFVVLVFGVVLVDVVAAGVDTPLPSTAAPDPLKAGLTSDGEHRARQKRTSVRYSRLL
jgi:hypothetical protein